jgi:hypothetical protein
MEENRPRSSAGIHSPRKFLAGWTIHCIARLLSLACDVIEPACHSVTIVVI